MDRAQCKLVPGIKEPNSGELNHLQERRMRRVFKRVFYSRELFNERQEIQANLFGLVMLENTPCIVIF